MAWAQLTGVVVVYLIFMYFASKLFMKVFKILLFIATLAFVFLLVYFLRGV